MSVTTAQNVASTIETGIEEREHYYFPAVEIKTKKGYRALKRAFDIVFSALLFLILLVPMIILGIIVWLTSKGPILYRQERLGLNGKPFNILKFRSMHFDAEKEGPRWAKPDDDRCTTFGKFLRKTKLDELPQLWNILAGDMSFVGPRPERAVFYEEFETYIHGFKNRLAVIPGLTGWAQVNGGYDLRPEEKIVYDLEYIEKRSLKMDIKCIFMTVVVVFTNKGVR